MDAAVTGGRGTDPLLIKIWDKTTSNVMYDNQMRSSDTAAPTTFGGGDT